MNQIIKHISKYRFKDFIFIMVVILFIVGLAICIKHYVPDQKLYCEIIFNPTAYILYIAIGIGIAAYIFCPEQIRILLSKICCKKLEDVTGEKITTVNDDQWKQKITKPDLGNKAQNVPVHLNEQRDKVLTPLINAFKDGKLVYVISETQRLLTTDVPSNIKIKLRALLEFAYAASDSYPLQKRINNLALLCQQQGKKTPLTIRISFEKTLTSLYMANNQIKEASSTLDKILCQIQGQMIPAELNAELYDLQASLMLKMNKHHIALAYFKKALSLSTESALYEYKIAMIYFHGICRPWKALEYAKSAFSHLREDDNTELYEILVNICFYLEAFLGNYQNAYEFTDRSSIQNSHILACKAYILIKLEKYDEAFLLAQKVIDKDPSQVTAFNAKGIVLLKRHEYTTAERCFSVVIPEFEKDTDIYAKYYTAEAYYHRGICNIQLNNLKQAVLDFHKAEELDYTDFEANYLDTIHRYIVEHNENEPNK